MVFKNSSFLSLVKKKLDCFILMKNDNLTDIKNSFLNTYMRWLSNIKMQLYSI